MPEGSVIFGFLEMVRGPEGPVPAFDPLKTKLEIPLGPDLDESTVLVFGLLEMVRGPKRSVSTPLDGVEPRESEGLGE